MVNKTNKGKQPARRNPKKGQSKGKNGSPLVGMAQLLNDPCNASLVHPEYGVSSSGYLIRHSRTTVVDTTDVGNGYLVWFPDYSNGTATGNFNMFYYQSATASGSPINTTANPLGSGGTATDAQGQQLRDPSATWCSTTTVQDSRTAAACIKMMYLGRNDALAGRVAVLENIPREALLTGGGSAPPSITEMFEYANHTQRTALDYLEVKFRPSDGSEHFKKSNTESDACFTFTASTAATSVPASGPTGAGLGIGFAWAGVIPGSDLGFDFVKVCEWRPEMNSGIVTVPPVIKGTGGNMMSRAVALLDNQVPGWQTQVKHIAKSIGARVVQKTFEGSLNLIERAAPMLM